MVYLYEGNIYESIALTDMEIPTTDKTIEYNILLMSYEPEFYDD